MTYREIIIKVLRDKFPDWTPSYDLEKVNTKYGWIGLRGTRTCRDLVRVGSIEKKLEDGYVWYRYKERPPEVLSQFRREDIRQQTLI